MKLKKILLLFGLLIGLNATVFGQSLTREDSTGVFYTVEQDKNCLECLINAPKKDTIIKRFESAVLKLEEVIANDSLIIEIKAAQIERQAVEIKELNRKVKRQKFYKWLFGGIGAAGTVYFILKP